jgi:hypothetical protein
MIAIPNSTFHQPLNMGWFTKSKKSSNASRAPPHETSWSTYAGWTASNGVDPPLLRRYQARESPQYHYSHPGPHYEYQAPNLNTINEAMPSIAGGEDSEDGNSQLFAIPLKRPSTPRYLLDDPDRIPLEARSPSPASSRSLADYNSSPYPSPHTPSVVIEPSVLPPTQEVTSPKIESSSKPTCSLNLMCYRSGS